MKSTNQLFNQVEKLREIFVSKATGEEPNESEYSELRRTLISNQIISSSLPQFVRDCRNLQEFWDYIKPMFSKYAERRNHLRQEFSPLLNFLETETFSITQTKDLFEEQFPMGMPFGTKKPSLAVTPYQKSQKIYFEETEEIGLIKRNVYPNLTYSKLQTCLAGTKIAGVDMKQALLNMCQTDCERKFLEFYANKSHMWILEVPILIPQAWIQWHSSTKKELRANNSSYSDELYRVDFVAFWNNKRYAILIDDISHYAKKNCSYWNADEEKYSMRLKEDRKLRKEGWEVFRVSNWEIRNQEFINELLDDLLNYFGVDFESNW